MSDFIYPLSDEFKNIYFIKGARDGKYPYSHSLLIGDYLIDTGISSRLLRKLKRLYPINNVLLSHWHEDHISGNRLLPNAKYYIHLKDKFLIENINKFNEFYGISNSPAEEDFEWLMDSLRLINIKCESIIEDNDIIAVGDDFQIQVIHTPGHTAGHCAFLERTTNIAFFADIDLTKFAFYGGIDSNLVQFEESIDRLKKVDIKIAITGHKGIIRGNKQIKQELNDYKSIIHKRDDIILSLLSEIKPVLLEDYKGKNIIYRYYSEFKQYELVAEMIMIQKHFDKFLQRGLVNEENNGYILA